MKKNKFCGFFLTVLALFLFAFVPAVYGQTTPEKLVLPPLPEEKGKALWDSCTLVDYVFFDLPISMSLDQQTSIRMIIRHIGLTAPEEISATCKPIGKVFYQIDGNIVLSASLYCNEQCAYFVFFEGEQKKYANLLTREGYDFYKKTIDSVKSGH